MSRLSLPSNDVSQNPSPHTEPTCEAVDVMPSVDSLDPFDPASLRLGAAATAGIGVKRVMTGIRVEKPKKQEFVRVHPDANYRLDTALLQDTEKEFYLVAPVLWPDLAGEIRPVKLVTAITRHGSLFLWPATLPPTEGRTNRWHGSMLQAQSLATKHWVRVQSDMSAGEYTVYEATGNLPNPEWPNMTFQEILKLAFRDRLIDSFDHAVLRSLRGEV